MRSIPKFKIDGCFYCRVVERLNELLDELTVNDIDARFSSIKTLFGISRYAIVLADMEIIQCYFENHKLTPTSESHPSSMHVQNHWLIPISLLHHVHSEVQKNRKLFSDFYIISFQFKSDKFPSPIKGNLKCDYIMSVVVFTYTYIFSHIIIVYIPKPSSCANVTTNKLCALKQCIPCHYNFKLQLFIS